MKRLGFVLVAIVGVGAATLLYLYEHGRWLGRTIAVEQRTAALEQRVDAGEQRAQALEQQGADTQQRTAELERDARERAAQVSKIAADLQKSEDENRRMVQQLSHLEKQAPSSEMMALAQDLTVMSSLKVGVVEYYLSQGRWPNTNAEVGLPAPEQYHGSALQSAAVQPDGVIEMKFQRRGIQTPGVLRLIADASNEAMGVRWRCESPNYPDIGRLLSACTYTGH